MKNELEEKRYFELETRELLHQLDMFFDNGKDEFYPETIKYVEGIVERIYRSGIRTGEKNAIKEDWFTSLLKLFGIIDD